MWERLEAGFTGLSESPSSNATSVGVGCRLKSTLPGKAGTFVTYPDGRARLLLKADPTNQLVWHELGHFVQWRRIGSEAYRALTRSTSFNAPEQFVFDLLERPDRWRRLTPQFPIDSAEYIEEVGGFR